MLQGGYNLGNHGLIPAAPCTVLCEIFPQDTLCITGTQAMLVVLYSTKDTVGLIVQYKTSCLLLPSAQLHMKCDLCGLRTKSLVVWNEQMTVS